MCFLFSDNIKIGFLASKPSAKTGLNCNFTHTTFNSLSGTVDKKKPLNKPNLPGVSAAVVQNALLARLVACEPLFCMGWEAKWAV
jgi:hypothetical protein